MYSNVLSELAVNTICVNDLPPLNRLTYVCPCLIIVCISVHEIGCLSCFMIRIAAASLVQHQLLSL